MPNNQNQQKNNNYENIESISTIKSNDSIDTFNTSTFQSIESLTTKLFPNIIKSTSTYNKNLLFDVPKDGNCLFWSILLAYLRPVKNNQQSFQKRYENLFGNKKDSKKIFDFDNFDFDNNKNLFLLFRNRVVDYMEENIKDFENFQINKNFSEYLQKMRKNGEWGSEIELSAISKLLNLKIIVDKTSENKEKIFSKIYPENFDSYCENEIKIIHINDNHYQYYLNNDYQVSNINQSQNLVNCQPITIINTINQSDDLLLTSLNDNNNLQKYHNDWYRSKSYEDCALKKALEFVKLNNKVLSLKMALKNEEKSFTEINYNLRNLIYEVYENEEILQELEKTSNVKGEIQFKLCNANKEIEKLEETIFRLKDFESWLEEKVDKILDNTEIISLKEIKNLENSEQKKFNSSQNITSSKLRLQKQLEFQMCRNYRLRYEELIDENEGLTAENEELRNEISHLQYELHNYEIERNIINIPKHKCISETLTNSQENIKIISSTSNKNETDSKKTLQELKKTSKAKKEEIETKLEESNKEIEPIFYNKNMTIKFKEESSDTSSFNSDVINNAIFSNKSEIDQANYNNM